MLGMHDSRDRIAADMFNTAESNGQGLDYLIARSGFIGRQILKIAGGLYRLQVRLRCSETDVDGRLGRVPHLLPVLRRMETLALLAFTYYVGGSLTRGDQQALARLTGMGIAQAHRLTLFNALLFGIPTALGYFVVGEGAHWVGDLHSLAVIPSWVFGNASRLIGAVSLGVDLFRAADAALNRRCWAPFGTFPVLINLPTYVKMLSRRLMGK